MVSTKSAMDGVMAFAVRDVLPKMPNGVAKFAAYMALGALKNDPEPAIRPYEAFLKMSGVLSEDGCQVDELRLGQALADAFAAMPSVNFLGFTFTVDDAERLVAHVAKGA